MKKLLFILIIAISHVSCLEITQKLTVRQDKSGTYAVWIDVSALQFMQEQQGIGDLFTNVSDFAEKAKVFLQNKKGISQIVDLTDKKKGIYGVQFDFDNPSNLNALTYQMAGIEKMFLYPNVFTIQKRSITIKNMTPVLQKAMKQDSQASDRNNFFADQIRNYIFFNTVIETPRKIRKVSNNRAFVQDNIVKLRISLYEIEQGTYYGIKVKY